MNWRAIRAVIRKDLLQAASNRIIWVSFIGVPVMLLVIMPVGMVLMPQLVPEQIDLRELETMLRSVPPGLKARLGAFLADQMWVMLAANYMFMPFFLLVPMMISSIIAADGIAGEKERKTLEGLLYMPISDAELFISKVLAAWIPALAITLVSFIVYGLAVNLAGYGTMQRLFFPEPAWWPLVFLVAPAVSLASLAVTVIISAKAKSFMAAQQASGFIVLPVIALMVGQVSGLFFLSTWVVLLIGVLFWAIALMLAKIATNKISRDELVTQV